MCNYCLGRLDGRSGTSPTGPTEVIGPPPEANQSSAAPPEKIVYVAPEKNSVRSARKIVYRPSHSSLRRQPGIATGNIFLPWREPTPVETD